MKGDSGSGEPGCKWFGKYPAIGQTITALMIAFVALHSCESTASENCAKAGEYYDSGRKLLNLAERRDAFAKAVELCPGYPEAHVNLADAYEKLEQFETAERHYSRAVQLGLVSPIPFIGLGEVYLKTGRYTLAVENCEKGIAIDPGNERLKACLKVARERLDREKTFFTAARIKYCLIEDDQFRLMCMCPEDYYSFMRKWICMPVVLFSPGSAELCREATRQLDAVGEVLRIKELDGRQWLILGHADSIGDQASNTRLSKRRAERVKRYLVERYAMDPQRFTVLFFGEDRPRGPNTTSAGRAENRRVEIAAENL